MQATTWQGHLHTANKVNPNLTFTDWVSSICAFDELFSAFLKSVWLADKLLLEEKDVLSNLIERMNNVYFIRDMIQTPSDLGDVVIQALERIPSETYNKQIIVYQDILLDFYRDGPASAFQMFKAFLAKTGIGVLFAFYENCKRGFPDDLDFRMDLELLCVIRDEAQGKTDSLARWEAWLLRKVDSCISNPNVQVCDPALHYLVPLGHIWRLQKPSELIAKCIELEYRWPHPPKDQVLVHMTIYIRQAIVQLCAEEKWSTLVKFRTGIQGWAAELFMGAFNHPKLEEYAIKIAEYEKVRMENLQNKPPEEIVKDLEIMTRE